MAKHMDRTGNRLRTRPSGRASTARRAGALLSLISLAAPVFWTLSAQSAQAADPVERRHPLAELAASVERTLNRTAPAPRQPAADAWSATSEPTVAEASAAALYSSVPQQARELQRRSGAAPDPRALMAAAAELAALPAGALPPAAAPADPAAEPAQTEEPTPDLSRDRSRRSRAALSSVASGSAQAAASSRSLVNSTDPGRFTMGDEDLGFGNPFGGVTEANEILPGFSVDYLSVSTGISSNGTPPQQARLAGLNLGSDYDMGISGRLSYQHTGRRTGFLMNYTPTHVQRGRFSEWSSTNHRLNLQMNRELSRRWSMSSRVGAGDSALEQFWFTLPVLRTVETDAQTLDDVFDQLAGGELSEEEAASLLTGAPIVEKPGDQRLAIGRALSLNAGASASYAYSPRLTLAFSGRASSNRLYDDPVPDDGRERLVSRGRIGRVQNQGVGVSATYRLGARTDVGWRHNMQWFQSSLQENGSQSSNAFFSQQLTRSWAYQVSVGMGALTRLRRVDTIDGTLSESLGSSAVWNYGGRLTYSRDTQTFSLSANRGLGGGGDLSFGQRQTTNLSANWQWNPLRSAWMVNAGGSYYTGRVDQRIFEGTAQQRQFESSLVRGGFGRVLTPSTSLRTEYYFGRYMTPFQGLFSDIVIHRVQASLIWRPIFR